jgi:hypothetical protein
VPGQQQRGDAHVAANGGEPTAQSRRGDREPNASQHHSVEEDADGRSGGEKAATHLQLLV